MLKMLKNNSPYLLILIFTIPLVSLSVISKSNASGSGPGNEAKPQCEGFTSGNISILSLNDLDIIYDLRLTLISNSSTLESVVVAPTCKFLTCSETKLKGECREFSESKNTGIDTDTMTVRSASCKCSPSPTTGAGEIKSCAVLYDQWYFSGESKTVIFPGSVGKLGENDTVRSALIRKSCKVNFWSGVAGNSDGKLKVFEETHTLIKEDDDEMGKWYCCHCDTASEEVCNRAKAETDSEKVAPFLEGQGDFSQFVKYGKKIIGIGRNYRWKHSELTKVLSIPVQPIVFLKPSSSYIVEGQKIQLPESLGTIFYETELGVVIGKKGKSIDKSQALDYVAGYFLGLDMTAKEFLKKSISQGKPWEIGKGFDTACSVGHFIPKHLIPNPNDINLVCKINGNVTQNDNTSNMIFDVQTLISYISKYMTLEPYDVILTGTPDGLGAVKHGDVIESQLGNLTTIRFEVEVVKS